jgi:molybdenum-pterin binding domain
MISARNQLAGKILAVQEGAVNGIVVLKTNGGDYVTATISMAAIKELELAPDKQASAVIKATDVMIGVGDVKISARNKFAGEIASIEEGAVNAIATLKTEGGEIITATISMSAIKELGLAPGTKATAIVKATSVMISL